MTPAGLWRHLTSCLMLLFLSAGAADAAPAPPPLSIYGMLPAVGRVALSPSGARVAMISLVGETSRLVVVNIDGKTLINADVGDQKVRRLDWGGDDNVLLTIGLTVKLGEGFAADKAEMFKTMVIPLNGPKIWTVFQGKANTSGTVSGYYGSTQRDGHAIGFFSALAHEYTAERTHALQPDLYEVDLNDGSTRQAAVGTGVDFGSRRWIIDARGKIAGIFDFDATRASWTIRDGDGKVAASGRSALGTVSLQSIGRTPGTLLYEIDDADTGMKHWIETGGGKSEEILGDKPVLNLFIDEHSRQLIGYLEGGETPTERFFDLRLNKVMAAARKPFPGLSVRLVDWNLAFDRLIVRTDGPGDPGSWWLIDAKAGTASSIGTSYELKAENIGPARMVHYKAGDGLQITGVLTLPPGRDARNLPVMVFPHDGPASWDTVMFDWWAQAFASRGYAVFQPNFRGSAGFGTAFEKAGHGEWGRKMQTDISDGLAELARQGIVDPKRACIMGTGYGGYAALAGVTLQQGLYRCAVSVAGISDVAGLVKTKIDVNGGNEVVRRKLEQEMGSLDKLKLVSPVRFADRADAPVLLIHGKDDVVVLYDQSTAMATALRKANKVADLVTPADWDHWLSRSKTRLAMLEASVAFVEKYNPPDPEKH